MKFRLNLTVAAMVLLLCPILASAQETADGLSYPGEKSIWEGFTCYDFQFEGRDAKIVVPETIADGTPWMWRARFFGHEPQADVALLKLGYHVVWIDSTPFMGAPQSVELWQKFYLYLTKDFGFYPKAHLEGMSRGGLYVMNWAIQYPDEAASIYIDNPVLDFKSWPGGFGKSPRYDGDWQDILKSYGLTEEEAKTFKGNPIDNPDLANLAERKVPILIVCGDSDKTVPFDENEKPLIDRYQGYGAPIETIIKPGCDHHPHSLVDPQPIVDFVVKAQTASDR